jgi:HSP20 family protein
MNIVKYDPFRELRGLQDELNRVFNVGFAKGTENEGFARGAWSPNVDIFEGEDKIVIEAELAGVKPEEVDISIENNVVTLKGARKFEQEDKRENFHRIERSYGTFTRSFTLPRTVAADEAKADFNNGILTVTLPKREEAKARKIEITGAPAAVKPASA